MILVMAMSPVLAVAWLYASDQPVPDLAQYGFAGAIITVAVFGVAWWARAAQRREDAMRADEMRREDAMRAEAQQREDALRLEAQRREDYLRAECATLRTEIKALNDRMLGELVPLTLRTAESAAQMARLFDVQTDLQRRERGRANGP